jgi:hypothetical protein
MIARPARIGVFSIRTEAICRRLLGSSVIPRLWNWAAPAGPPRPTDASFRQAALDASHQTGVRLDAVDDENAVDFDGMFTEIGAKSAAGAPQLIQLHLNRLPDGGNAWPRQLLSHLIERRQAHPVLLEKECLSPPRPQPDGR